MTGTTLLADLRSPANWLREDKGQDWKAGVSRYHRAPFEAADEIERLRSVLRHIAVMDVYTRDGEEPPHELMRRLAWEAIKQ